MSGAINGKGKREFDRHLDGTGRGHELDKKHGAGKGNWGEPGSEYQEEVDHAVRASLQEEAKLDAEGPERVHEADIPSDDKVMTLEEYEQKKAQK